ncbi:F-box protein PP2-B11 isoform X2 [Daucus carota subsp. sativus]|nr:PREDICTED: F-box protein PP2-B11-like isoform X1 [Daucus carota subsp. sativus]XP_017248330.1 PREDICTED: F-box protein PP2-B11-like isoform X2 [Daucus carota subsp. sativus]
MNNAVPHKSMKETDPCPNGRELSLVSRSLKESFLVSHSDTLLAFPARKHYLRIHKLSGNKYFFRAQMVLFMGEPCLPSRLLLSPSPLSQTPELICALENLEAYKKIITLMLAPTILFDLTASLSLDRFKGQEFEVCVRIDRSCDSQNMIVYMHMMPSARSVALSKYMCRSMVLRSLSPHWLSSDNTVHECADLFGNVSGMNSLPEELIEEIVSRTNPRDACRNLSMVSRSFCLAAKSDYVWDRFLPSELISRRAVSDQWLFDDPWKNIASDTLHAFPTKKDLYLFLADNPLIIDDGAMYFWLDKLSGNKCFHIGPEKLCLSEPNGWEWYSYSLTRFTGTPVLNGAKIEIYGEISTSLLSPNTAYTAYFLFNFNVYYGGFGEEIPLETCVGIDGSSNCENRIIYIPFMPKYDKYAGPYLERRLEMPVLPACQYPKRRDDGLYELELGDYFNKEGDHNRKLKMSLREDRKEKRGIVLHGIEIRPKCSKKIIRDSEL